MHITVSKILTVRFTIPNQKRSALQRLTMTIRQATPKDFDAIYSLVKTAF